MSILSWALKKELLFAYSQGLILLSKEGHKDVEAQGICALTATLYSSWGSLFLVKPLLDASHCNGLFSTLAIYLWEFFL